MILSALLLAGFTGGQEAGFRVEHFTQRGPLAGGLVVSKEAGSLRVLNGGAFGITPGPSAALLADLLESASLDAIAVGYEDLARATGDLKGLLASPKFPWICANVKGAGKSHVVREIGGRKIAFVAVTKPPEYKKVVLPEGWTIDDPGAALKAVLPELARSADVVVLFAIMDRIECARMMKDVAGIPLVCVPSFGGSDADPLALESTLMVQSPTGSEVLGRLSGRIEGKALAGITNRFVSAAGSESDLARIRALFERHKEPFALGGLTTVPEPPAVAETGPLTALEPGKVQPVVVRRSDGTVEIVVESMRVVEALGDKKAPPGWAWLVVESAWKNLIPLSRLGDQQLPTAYSVGEAANNLYAVVNGKGLSRLEVEPSGGAGGLLTGRSISVDRFGAVRRGILVFPVPSAGVKSLSLHFLDFRHPPLVFPLLEPGKRLEEKPLAPAVKNEILEMAVYGVERTATLGDLKPPAGKSVAIIDFRARSLVSFETPEGPIGVAGDLNKMAKSIFCLGEGNEEYPVAECLPESPRFLPHVMTGIRLVYVVPEKAAGLRLRCDFDEIEIPGGKTVKPKSVTFSLDPGARLCAKCGEPAGASDKFCGKCGSPLGR